jgi:hypothetical protein
MAVGIRRSALSLYHTEKSKEMTYSDLFSGIVTVKGKDPKHLPFSNNKTSRLIFHYGKDSKDRTRHFKKVIENGRPEDEYDARMEIITLEIIPESKVQKLEAEAEEYFKSKPEEGDFNIIPNNNDMLEVASLLIEKYRPDFFISMQQNRMSEIYPEVHMSPSMANTEVFTAVGRAIDNSIPSMNKIFKVIRKQPEDPNSEIVDLKEVKIKEIVVGPPENYR